MKTAPKSPGKSPARPRGEKPTLIYGVFGPDLYQREGFLHRLKKEVLPPGDNLNFESYPAGEGLAEGLNAARTLPFGAARKLVLIRNLEKLSEDEIPQLENYLSHPSSSTILVLEGNKASAKLKKLLAQAGELVEAEPIKESQVPDWLMNKAREAGRGLSREAAQVIAERVGSDLALASQELEKVLLYTDAKMVQAETVRKTLSGGSSVGEWDLANAIGARNLSGAIRSLNRLLASGDPPVMIVGQLASRIRKLFRTRLLLDKGKTEAEIGKLLKITNPSAVKYSCRDAQGYTQAEIRRGLRDLSKLDLKLKRSGLSPRLLLEMFLVGFVSGKSPHAPKSPVRNQ